MKPFIVSIIITLSSALLFARKIAPSITLVPGKVIDGVLCQSDASQTYAVYIPVIGNALPLPIVYFFDAHGAGALPLNKYKALADEYGFILVGSNNSKNGNDWTTTDKVWQSIFTDTQKRLKINSNRMYTCGFSGGAKVAGYVALKYLGIKGVIANGAGLPDGVAAGDYNFSFTAVAGMGDMNMAPLVTFAHSLDNTRTRHRTILFDGKHEWAPETTMGIAFAGLQLDAMLQGLVAKDGAFINSYIAKSKNRVGVLYQANQLIKAEQECQLSVSFLEGLSKDADWFRERATAIAGNKQYQKQQQEQQALLAKEQTIQALYQREFEQGDADYWAKTIAGLKTAAAAKTPEGMMNQRLLAWLSLAFYSISNQFINSNQNDGARHFVDLYKLADPTNSEAWYLSAVLDAREGHAQAVEKDLLKAIACGFNDKKRLHQQPEFKNLPTPINFTAIESKMGNN
jgi:hypothetical protein